MNNSKRKLTLVLSIAFMLTLMLSIKSLADIAENTGVIENLPTGDETTITLNSGTVTNVNTWGNILTNNGTVTNLNAGHVGTNYGTIYDISNTGTLGENDETGIVTYNRNEIERNDGTVSINAGNINKNYGTIGEMRSGEVLMCTGSTLGTYTGGLVSINQDAMVTITNNNAPLSFSSGTLTIENNTSTITLGDGAVLHLTNNYGTILKKQNYFEPVTISVDIANDKGKTYILDYYPIEIIGDESAITFDPSSEIFIENKHYAEKNGNVIFTLDPDYGCKESSDFNEYQIIEVGTRDDNKVTITVHKHELTD